MSKDWEISMVIFPKWIEPKEKCLHCRSDMMLSAAGPNEEETGVNAFYGCINSKCRHLEIFKRPFLMGMTYEGKKYVQAFKDAQNPVKTEQTKET